MITVKTVRKRRARATAAQFSLSGQMMSYWTRFAATFADYHQCAFWDSLASAS
jgi:hypothetical protein